MLRLGRLAGWRLGHLERMVDEIQSCFLHVLDADWVLGLDQSPRFPVCLDRVASCWPRMVLCVLFVICMSLGCAVTEGEVRRCPCWVCISQSRVGGENSSLRASARAGRERDQGQAWMSRRARQALRVVVQEYCTPYPGTFLTCPWKVSSNVVGSACLPRLASCKYFLSPSGSKYHQADGCPLRKYRIMPSVCPSLYDVYFSRPRDLEVSRSRLEVPLMFSHQVYGLQRLCSALSTVQTVETTARSAASRYIITFWFYLTVIIG